MELKLYKLTAVKNTKFTSLYLILIFSLFEPVPAAPIDRLRLCYICLAELSSGNWPQISLAFKQFLIWRLPFDLDGFLENTLSITFFWAATPPTARATRRSPSRAIIKGSDHAITITAMIDIVITTRLPSREGSHRVTG